MTDAVVDFEAVSLNDVAQCDNFRNWLARPPNLLVNSKLGAGLNGRKSFGQK